MLKFRPVYGEETVQEEVINDDTAELSLSKMEEEAQVKFNNNNTMDDVMHFRMMCQMRKGKMRLYF